MEPNTNFQPPVNPVPPVPPNQIPQAPLLSGQPSFPAPGQLPPAPQMPPNQMPPPAPQPGPPSFSPPPASGFSGPGMPPPAAPVMPLAPMGGQVISGGFNPSASTLPGSTATPGGGTMPPPAPGVSGGMVVGAVNPAAAAAAAPPPSSGRSWKPLIIALIAVLILGIGSAAAYFGVVVPNQPANVLKSAFINTLEQTQSEATGTINDSANGFKIGLTTAENSATKTADIQLNLTAEGLTFPVESRLVNHNVYVKVGDLSSVASLLNAYSPQAGSLAQTLSTQLSNKWIVFDSTLIDQSPQLNCALNSSWTLTNADIQTVESQYNAHPFATIKSTATATVGGAAAEKFNLSISNAAFNGFGNGLRNLSLVKNLSKCVGAPDTSTSSSANHGSTALTIWVDKSTKRIVQVANTTDGVSTSVTLSYKPVNITAPTGAIPALQALADLQNTLTSSGINLSQLLGGSSSGTTL